MATIDRLIEIFDQANARPAGAERESFLAESCQDDPELKEQVLALLQSDAKAGGFLQNPAFSAPVGQTEQLGETIGCYKLLEMVGEGGCGVVYVAEQSKPVRRRVALKIIKLGMDTRQVVARFEAERQALAMMDHPNIARVLEAGSTGTGRPYFVMELVRGIRITEFCDQNQLSTRERLDLFIKVCHAIQHAHQKGVIHRDIKPSNILVTLHDGVPIPKVIDFGIAKATQGRLTEGTVYTNLLHFIGTPAYMSPEQAELSGLDTDTRSDIYSLGVLLYELLTGQPPFNGQTLMSSGIDAMRKTIREQEPVRPSTQLTRNLAVTDQSLRKSRVGLAIPSDAETTAHSLHRSRMKDQINRLRGDLDWIVMKCLEKDRSRRYETANGLSADLNRHLNNEPVLARPPSAAYKLQKAFCRNRLMFSAGAAVVAALVLGISVSLWQMIEASKAREKAEAARATAREQSDKAQAAENRAVHNLLDTHRSLYAARVNLAHQFWLQGNLAQAQATLESVIPGPGDEDLRGFEWRYLRKLLQDESSFTFTNLDFVGVRGGLALAGSNGVVVSAGGNSLKWVDMTDGRETQPEVVEAGSIHLLAAPMIQTGTLAYCVGGALMVLSPERKSLWSVAVTNEICTAIAWSSDASMLASAWSVGTSPASTWETAGVVRIRNGKSGELIGESRRLGGGIRSLAFNPGSKSLACGTTEPRIHILEVPGLGEVTTLGSHTAFVVALAFDHSGTRLASGSHDSHIILWNLPQGRQIARLSGHNGQVLDLAFSPDDQQLVSGGSDHTVRLWNLTNPAIPTLLRGHQSGVVSVLFSADGTEIYSGSDDGRTKVWRTRSLDTTNTLTLGRWLGGIAFSPVSNLLAVADFHNQEAILWDVSSRNPAGRVRHVDSNGNLAFSPDGKLLATDGGGKVTLLWDVSSRARVHEFPRANVAQSVAFHPSLPILAIGSTDIRFWNTQSLEQTNLLVHPPTQRVSQVAFSRDGTEFALGMGGGIVSVWDLATGREMYSYHEHTKSITALSFSENGNILASGDLKGRIVLFDPRQGMVIRTFDDQISQVGGLAFTPDSNTLVSTSRDGTILFRRLDSGQVALRLVHDGGPVNSVAFSPDENIMATTGSDGNVRLWPAVSRAEIGR